MLSFTRKLQQHFESSPEQVVLRLLYNHRSEQIITYSDLLKGATGYARALEQASIRPGEVVVLILQHGETVPFAFFGAVLHGAIPSILPFLTEKLSPDQYRRSLTSLFQVTSPAAVITYPEFESEVLNALSDQQSSVRRVLLCDRISPSDTVNLTSLPGWHTTADDIVLLQHSSGTTGLQKGVALSHQAVFNNLENLANTLKITPEDVVVSWLPLYHDMGLIAGFLLPILLGNQLVLMSPFDWVRAPYRLFQAVSQYHGTLTWMPNFAYNFCAQKILDKYLTGVDLHSWRAIINCSEPMFWRSMQQFIARFEPYGLRRSALAASYAMAENVFAVTQSDPEADLVVDVIHQNAYLSQRIAQPIREGEPSLNVVSAGPTLANTTVRIMDEQHQALPDRHIGEIALKSNCMLTGYYHRPDATQQAFHDGWYLTGDLGYVANGEIFITGRKKDLIIVGGKNIYPQDLENLACEVPGVHPGRVAAFGVINETAGTEDVVMVAEVEEHISESPESQENTANLIRQFITSNSDISLRYVKLVEKGWLIKTSSGKVARSANREKYLAALVSDH